MIYTETTNYMFVYLVEPVEMFARSCSQERKTIGEIATLARHPQIVCS